MHGSYRADIDGLRAVAVIPVVLFHAGLGIPGGFTGVDIFFVISGYLITLGLFKDAEGGRLSILRFYERRVRRIVPALTVVVVASCIAGAILLLPSELRRMSASVIATALFSSNIYFWKTQDYFAGENIANPLLHTWSLAVEEQFYIFWPLIVLAMYRLNLARFRVALIAAAILVSLALAQAMLSYSPHTAFYMFPLRAWELLLGSLLATGAIPAVRSRIAADALSLVALAMIGWSMFALSEASAFPGVSAIPACLGSAMLIHLGGHSRSIGNRILAWRPLVLIGLISYSLYLWHWPIFSFAWLARDGVPPSLALALALVALSVIAAALSWRFVELPFRSRAIAKAYRGEQGASPEHTPAPATQRRVLVGGGGALTALALIGGVGMAGAGFPGRVPAAVRAVDGLEPQAVAIRRGCMVTDDVPEDFAQACLSTAGDSPVRVVLWGDSMARHYINTLAEGYRQASIEPLYLIATGCAPLPGVVPTFGEGRRDERCKAFNDEVLQTLRNTPDLEHVIIAGRWSNLAGLTMPGGHSVSTSRYLLTDPDGARNLDNSLTAMEAGLTRALEELQRRGVGVTLIKEPPRYPRNVKPCTARALWSGADPASACDTTIAEQRRFRAGIDRLFARLGQRFPEVVIHDPLPALCTAPGGRCVGYADGELMTEDVDHLSRAGSDVALSGLSLPMPDGSTRSVAAIVR